MNKIIFLVASLISLSAAAAPPVYPTKTGSTTNLNDDVRLPIDGGQYASVKITVSGTFSQTLTPELTFDGMFWDQTSTPYSVEVDLSTATPTVVKTITTTGIFELVIPHNTLGVRVRASAVTSGTATIMISAGRLDNPATQASAILYSSAGYIQSTGRYAYNMAGWNSAMWAVAPTSTCTYATSIYAAFGSATSTSLSPLAEIDYFQDIIPAATSTSTWVGTVSREPITATGTGVLVYGHILHGSVPLSSPMIFDVEGANATSTVTSRVVVNR
jgi:hypothetical protein